MSIGFDNGKTEFHTTTAYAPHSQALSEILKGLSSLIEAQTSKDEFMIEWSRNPEAYNLFFKRVGENLDFQVVEYPTFNRDESEKEIVFSYQGQVKDFCQSFYQTFAQLYADRDTDEFEFNWRQPFPFEDFAEFEEKVKSYGQ
jgi:hypothetical protein